MSASLQLLDIEFGDFENEGDVLHLLRKDCSAVQIYWERAVQIGADCDASSGPAPEEHSIAVGDDGGNASSAQVAAMSAAQPLWTGSEWTEVTQASQPDSVVVSFAGAAPEPYGAPSQSHESPHGHDPKNESVVGASHAQDVSPPKTTEPYIQHMHRGNNLNQMNPPAENPYIVMPHHVTMAHVHVTQAATIAYNDMYKGTDISASHPIMQPTYAHNMHPYGGDHHPMMQPYHQHDNYRPNDFRKPDDFRSNDGSRSMNDMPKTDQYRGMYDEHNYGQNRPNASRSAPSKLYEKTYERRNKKKRPRDYYERFGQDAVHMPGGRYGNQMDNYQDVMMGGGNMRNHVPYGNGQPGILGMPPNPMMNFSNTYLPDTSVPPPGMMPVDLNNIHHLNMHGYKQAPTIQMPGNSHPTMPNIYAHNNHMLRARLPEPSAVDVHHAVPSESMQRTDMADQMYSGVPITQNSSTGLHNAHNPSRAIPSAPPFPAEEGNDPNQGAMMHGSSNEVYSTQVDPKEQGGPYPVNISQPGSLPNISQHSAVNYEGVTPTCSTHLTNSHQGEYTYESELSINRTDGYSQATADNASQGRVDEFVIDNIGQKSDIDHAVIANTNTPVGQTDIYASQVESSANEVPDSTELDKELSFLGEPLPSVDLNAPPEESDKNVHPLRSGDFAANSEITNTGAKVDTEQEGGERTQTFVSPVAPVTSSTPEKEKVEAPAGQELQESAATVKTPDSIDSAKVVDSVEPQTAKVSSPADSTTTAAQYQTSWSNSAAPAQTAPKPKTTSWASLFKKDGSASNSIVVYNYDASNKAGNGGSDASRPGSQEKDLGKDKLPQTVPTEEDKAAKELGEFLLEYKLNHKSVSLQPRGLVNRANWCYVNSVLQGLLACPPFYHLLKSLPAVRSSDGAPSSTPVMDSLVQFVSEFSALAPLKGQDRGSGNKGNKMPVDLPLGAPFEPVYVYKMLQIIQYDAAFKHGRQEDAEEFLSCLLNGLHEEMVAATKFASNENGIDVGKPNGDVASQTSGVSFEEEEEEDEEEKSGAEEDSQWEQVGPKNKSVITRAANFQKSPAWEIFGGQIRSSLQKQGLKETATLQPFFTLQLDIQSDKVFTLKDALDALVSKESIQGFTCSKTKKEVEASRRITLEELPAILLLHLKCMVYDSKSGGIQKIFKKVDFDVNLDINKDLLSPSARSRYSANQRQYKLLAVVSHHGSRAIGGHYTTDYFHPGLNGWVQGDDSNIKLVTLPSVLKFVPSRVPYLIMYRRADLI